MTLLSEHYPERLGLAICVDPPFYFQIFWKVAASDSQRDFASKKKKKKRVYQLEHSCRDMLGCCFFLLPADLLITVFRQSVHLCQRRQRRRFGSSRAISKQSALSSPNSLISTRFSCVSALLHAHACIVSVSVIIAGCCSVLQVGA
jgi:hypothetical protein